jgi:hypothetical protein
MNSINKSLDHAKQIDYESWSEDLVKWLNSDSAKNYWSSEAVNGEVIAAISEYNEAAT